MPFDDDTASGSGLEPEDDPNVWFGNVEQIASERIGRETVTYVSNVCNTTSPTG